jgi:hypothetical protein
MAFRSLRIDALEPITEPGGTMRWHPLRHTLGVQAFGVNAYSSPDAGGEVIEDHHELGSGAGRHEELYVVLAGRARFTVDGEEIDAPPGTCVFLPDPASRRKAVAEAAGTVVLAVGGARGEPYEVSPWEWSFRASPHAQAEDWEQAAAIVRDGLNAHPGNAGLLYDLTCYEARLGRLDDAAGHLREAFAASADEVRRWAAEDGDLDPLRERPDFPL